VSTGTLERPVHRHEAPPPGSPFAGTFGLVRLYLRRDRVVLPLWVLLMSVPLAPVYMASIAKVYPTQPDRTLAAATIMANASMRAMYGNIYNDSLGAVGIWKAGLFHTLIAVAVILTVIRHTRAEEETGRVELIDSTATGRFANLTAALTLAFGASIVTGVIAAASLSTAPVPRPGSVAFGLALACSGLVFSAVAAVAAQLSTSARIARGIAFAVLGLAFTLRAVGDPGSGTLSWLSPLGWSLQVRPYAGDRWWVLLLHLSATTLLTLAAYQLLRGRDIGSGLITERPGAPTASPWLSGPFGLAWRLQRGPLLAWTIGVSLYGGLIGSVVNSIGNQLGNNPTVRAIVNRLGGTQVLENAFIAIAFNILAVAASAMVLSATLRLHQEETAQRGEVMIAEAIGRSRWALSHLTFAIVGSAVAMLAAGFVTGLTYGIAVDAVGVKVRDVLTVAATQLPAIWLLAAVTLALFGLLPRFTPVAWAVLVGFVAIYLLGSIDGFPHWLLDLVPYTHTQRFPGAPFRAAPVLWLLLIDIALTGVGLAAFRRRDLR
jgi:ABC-2 type transport system permease protein